MNNEILWEKAPHTEMKHEILRRYLAAWLPIISSWSNRLIIIDGFAGPGEYKRGEPGSPLIILDTIINHKLKDRMREVVLLFIEKDNARADYLESLLLQRYSPVRIEDSPYELESGRIKFQIIRDEFEATLRKILDYLQGRGIRMAPCFAFIDPFGPSGMPMELIARLMGHPNSETLINFALDSINRFLCAPTHEKIFDELYACLAWRNFRKEEGISRHRGLLDLYICRSACRCPAKGCACARLCVVRKVSNRRHFGRHTYPIRVPCICPACDHQPEVIARCRTQSRYRCVCRIHCNRTRRCRCPAVRSNWRLLDLHICGSACCCPAKRCAVARLRCVREIGDWHRDYRTVNYNVINSMPTRTA
ncbi:MAG: three-Cys-motif partner protein TcmP [Paenibacillus sp.]|nr:three-Cys-motif partner protein TcmP [Paenibacillus sp.]